MEPKGSLLCSNWWLRKVYEQNSDRHILSGKEDAC